MTVYLVWTAVFIWLIILSFIVFKVKKHYQNLISATKKDKIDDILDQLVDRDKKMEKDVEEIKRELIKDINDAKLHLRKIGLVRFNPFERIGGDQSFVLALLNEVNDGIILNFIYTKEGLRVYTKRIRKGKGEEYELSDEEKKAVERSN